MGKPQKRQIVDKALPEEVKLMFGNTMRMGQLADYQDFLNFAKVTAGSSK